MTKFVRKNIVFLAALGLMTTGCAVDNTDEAVVSSALAISGSLGGGGASKPTMSKVGVLAVTDYSVRCVTLSGTPQAGTGVVGADGSFSLSLQVPTGETVPVGCFVIHNLDSSVAATFAIDSGQQGIGATGADTTQSGSVVGGQGETIDFGAIDFDADKGTATIAESNITRGGTASTIAGSWADPTGSWEMTCIVDDTYVCPEEGGSFPIYLHQMEATDGASVVHNGLSVWEDAAAYTGCGSTENLDALLPAGWAAVDGSMNTNFSFDGLPVASAVYAQAWGGSTGVCQAPVTQNTTTCDQVFNGGTASGSNNTDGWGNGSVSAYSDADCQAMCVVDNIWEGQGTCPARFSVNHSYTQAVTGAGEIATEVASFANGSTTNNYVVQADKPRNRFVIGELEVMGNVGTVLDSDSRTEHFCYDDDNDYSTACIDKTCVLTENVRMTIAQETASTAIVEVVIDNALDQTLSDAVCSQDVPGNWMYEGFQQTQKFLMNATKQ